MQRVIFHIDVDAYFAQVEQMLNPTLRGKPVIVGHTSNRGVVASASYEARAFGVHSAMPIARAKRLCPQAVFVNGHFRHYEEMARRIHELFNKYTPLVEMASLDEAYLDMSHTGSPCHSEGVKRPKNLLLGSQKKTLHCVQGDSQRVQNNTEMRNSAQEIKDYIKQQTGLNVSIGIGPNKLIAKIASAEAKPNGIKEVLAGEEQRFLNPLPIQKLPGVGAKTKLIMDKLGVRTIGDLARLPARVLKLTFGPSGESLASLARGIDDAPVVTDAQPKSIGRETTFEKDTRDLDFIKGMLSYLTERVAHQLRIQGFQAQTVTVRVRYADFTDETHSRKLGSATNQDLALYKTAEELLLKMMTSRTKKVRLVGVSGSSLITMNYYQADLFSEWQHKKLDRLYKSIDRIRTKYGFSALTVGQSIKLLKRLEKDKYGFKLHTPALSR
jgi:DNA polymerase-4